MPWGAPVTFNPFGDPDEDAKKQQQDALVLPPPPADYDPMQAFAQGLKGPADPGILGQSFGMLTPQEQRSDLDARFADFNKQNASIQQLERLQEQAKSSGNPMAQQSIARQLKLAQQQLPDIDQLQLMEAGDRPLATKTALRSAVENVPRAFGEGVLSLPEYAGIVKGYLGPGKVDDDSLLQWSQGAKRYVEGLFPGDAARQGDFSQQLASGLGSIATFYGAGAVAALAKLGPKATLAILAGMGSAQVGSQGFEEGTAELQAARRKAAASGDTASVTEYDRLLKTLGYTAVGTALAAPVGRTLFGTTGRNFTQAALEQGTTLAGAQAAENAITQATTNPNRSLTEGVADAGAVGGILGGLFSKFGRRRELPSQGEIDRGTLGAGVDGQLRLSAPEAPMPPIVGGGAGADNSPNPAPKPPEPQGPPSGGGYTEPPITAAKRDALYGKADESEPKLRDDRGVPQLDVSVQRNSLQQEVAKQLAADPKTAAKLGDLATQFAPESGAAPQIDAAAQQLAKTGKTSKVARELIQTLKSLPEQFGSTTTGATVRAAPELRPSSRELATRPGSRLANPSIEPPPRSSFGTGDILAAIGPRAELLPIERDKLGFYSKALEAARNWNQPKGTPEQVTAMLRAAGVKDSEITATGLGQFLAAKIKPGQNERAVVTRDELVQHLTQNRTPLQESTYGGNVGGRIADILEKEAKRYGGLMNSRASKEKRDALLYQAQRFRSGVYIPQAALDFADVRPLIPYDLELAIQDNKAAKWAKYSLDQSNPTYKETVLHLPSVIKPKMTYEEWLAKRATNFPDDHADTPGNRSLYEGQMETWARLEDKDWHSSHWGEPNIVAHLRTGEYQDTQGRKVTLLDELQSDEGQKIRELGLADSAKQAERQANAEAHNAQVQQRIDALQGRVDTMLNAGSSPLARVVQIARAYDREADTQDFAERALASGRMFSGTDMLFSSYYGFEPQVLQMLLDTDPEMARLKQNFDTAQAEQEQAYGRLLAEGYEYRDIRSAPAYSGPYQRVLAAEYAMIQRYEEPINNDPAHLLLAEIETERGRMVRPEKDKGRQGHPLINTTDQWVETGMRRLIQQAADNGSDGIAITPGKVQADRFNLTRVVNRIDIAEPQAYTGAPEGMARQIIFNGPIGVIGSAYVTKDGTILKGYDNFRDGVGKNLSEYIGKELTDKILAEPGYKQFGASDIEMGGSGMRATYDNIYPRALLKALRKLDKDIKPETTRLVATSFHPTESRPQGYSKWIKGTHFDNDFTFFPLTDKAKQALAERAQPLYAIGTPKGKLHEQGRERTGDGGRRVSSGSLAPLKGAPHVAGATGPDPEVVAAAEDYARKHGINLKRQAVFADINEDLATRIAQAYDVMPHAPQDPAVREAYDEMIQQTIAQYRELEAAGYQFYFYDEATDPYGGNPWNSIRDLRFNKRMAVFATEAGFGSGATDIDVSDGPLLAPTDIEWPYGSLDGPKKRVLANDLFRAVHDIFGHSIEGAGFRARGEENAWQAHIRLYTGKAVGAVTTETRGQNSWLNFGPYGKANQTASLEDTVFGDQKTGLMPSWAWEDGRVPDEPGLSDTDIVETLKVGAEMLRNWQLALRHYGPPEAAARAIETMLATDSRSPSAMQKALRAEGFSTIPNELLDQGLLVAHTLAAGRPDVQAALKGFYSPAERAAQKIKQEKATPDQWWKMISTTPGVRQEELHWLGLKPFLDEKNELMQHRPGSNLPPSMKTLPKEEVVSFIRDRQLDLEESLRRSEAPADWAAEQQRLADEENARRLTEWQALRDARLAGLPPPPPDAAEPIDEDAEDPYAEMMSDDDRKEEIDNRAQEIYNELRDEAINEQHREWYQKNKPQAFTTEIETALDKDDLKILEEAEKKLADAIEAWHADIEPTPPGLGVSRPPYPELEDFLPEDFEEDRFYFRIDKPAGANDDDYDSGDDGRYYRTREEAEASAEEWMDEYKHNFDEMAEKHSESLSEQDFAQEWSDALDQAETEWDSEHEGWVLEEDRGTPAERAELARQQAARERQEAIANINRPPHPVEPRRWSDQTKFKGYAIKGGDHYSELLVQLPKGISGSYVSPHFKDSEVVHVRYDMRHGPNNEKTLLIHEIQSDLHQRARHFGFGAAGQAKAQQIIKDDGFTPEILAEFERLRDLEEELFRQISAFRTPGNINEIQDQDGYNAKLTEAHKVTQQKQAVQDKARKLRSAAVTYVDTFGEKGAPDAPYTGDAWWQLGFRAALRQAVEEGADSIALTTPQQITTATYTPADVAKKFYGENVPRWADKYMKQWGSASSKQALNGIPTESQPRAGTTPEQAAQYFEQFLNTSDDDGGYYQGLLKPFIAMLRDPLFDPVDLRKAVEENSTAHYWAVNGYTMAPGPEGEETGLRFVQPLYERVGQNLAWPINDKMRKEIGGQGQPLFAQNEDSDDGLASYVRAAIEMGQSITLPDSFVGAIHHAAAPATPALPTEVDAWVIARFEPQGEKVVATFKNRQGTSWKLQGTLDEFLQTRAFYMPARPARPEGVFLLPFASNRRLAQRVRGEVRHEAIHALWKRLPAPVRSRLVAHAEALNILNISLADYLEAIGVGMQDDIDRRLKIGSAYFNYYQNRPDRQALIEQESVTHMAELYSHAALKDEHIAPVKADLDAIFRGDYSGPSKEPPTAPRRQSWLGRQLSPAFAGDKAKTADLGLKAKAQELEAQGESEDAIWAETGWKRGNEGRWRFEISDADARITKGADELLSMARRRKSMRLGNFYDHPQLFGAYPQLAEAAVELRPASKFGEASFTMPQTDFLSLLADAMGDDASKPLIELGFEGYKGTTTDQKRLKAMLTHEIQHAIQYAEDHALGSSPSTELKKVQQRVETDQLTEQDRALIEKDGLQLVYEKVREALGPMASKASMREWRSERQKLRNFTHRLAYLHYRAQSGEIEARLAEGRIDLNPEQSRRLPPDFAGGYADQEIGLRFEAPATQRYTSYLRQAQKRREKPMSFRDFKKALEPESL